jgi:alpha-tubulin suppressor-like RCC1 family protein
VLQLKLTALFGHGVETKWTTWIGKFNNYSSPKQVGSLTNWLKLAAGYYHTIAIKTDGTLWAWGNNVNGQLRFGNTTKLFSPKQVGSLTTWSTSILRT